MTQNIEYRVRAVTRYIVTRADHTMTGGAVSLNGSVSEHGEFDNFKIAYEVGYALCKAEHDRLGWPIDDERIKYPDAKGPFVPTVFKSYSGADTLNIVPARS